MVAQRAISFTGISYPQADSRRPSMWTEEIPINIKVESQLRIDDIVNCETHNLSLLYMHLQKFKRFAIT